MQRTFLMQSNTSPNNLYAPDPGAFLADAVWGTVWLNQPTLKDSSNDRIPVECNSRTGKDAACPHPQRHRRSDRRSIDLWATWYGQIDGGTRPDDPPSPHHRRGRLPLFL